MTEQEAVKGIIIVLLEENGFILKSEDTGIGAGSGTVFEEQATGFTQIPASTVRRFTTLVPTKINGKCKPNKG